MKAVMVLVLCGVALAMARPQELNQYDVDGVHVVDGPVSDVKVVDGPVSGNGGYPVIANPDPFFNQPPRPYDGGNNGGYPANIIIPDHVFYQPPGGSIGGQGGHSGARSARQVDQGFYQGGSGGIGPNNPNIDIGPAYVQPAYPNNPNIDISPAYVQYPNNYPGHLRPGQGHPGARGGK